MRIRGRMQAGSEVTIERMKEQDLPAILKIEQTSFTIPFSENLLRRELILDVAHLYVAKRLSSPAIIGYIDFWLIVPEMHIVTLAVDEEFRRQGIGTQLIEQMIWEGREKGGKRVTLEVRPSNLAAMSLYRSFGFQQVGIRKGYYQDNGEDASVLSLQL